MNKKQHEFMAVKNHTVYVVYSKQYILFYLSTMHIKTEGKWIEIKFKTNTKK